MPYKLNPFTGLFDYFQSATTGGTFSFIDSTSFSFVDNTYFDFIA